ncbi:SDR family oxidoreductase [bacterium]|nr:SDR family oxidoreductase [bacterium]
MDLNIQDRVALVTGASRGIGRVVASALAREGTRLILVARSQDQLDEVRKEIATPESQHCRYAIDLMAENGVAELVRAIRSDCGEPDIIVHSLGGSMGIPALAPAKDWVKVWYFNLGVGHELNRAFLPGMVKRRWGRIVHLSTLSTATYNGSAPYVSAKCALDGYVKTMNREVSKDNVIISAVAPGAIYSEGRYFAKLQKETPAALEDYFNNHLPIRRLGTGEDIGPVVAFLCSDFASFMAGAIVRIDGGGH